jgi:hypothetical protein
MDKDIKKDSVNIDEKDYQSIKEDRSSVKTKISIVDDRNDIDDSLNYMNIIDDFDLEFMQRQRFYPWEDTMSLNTGKPEDNKKTELNKEEEKKYKSNPPKFIQRRRAKVKSTKDMVSIPAAQNFSNIPMGRQPIQIVTMAKQQIANASMNTGIGTAVSVTGASAAEIPNGPPFPMLYRKPMIPPQRPDSTREQIVKLTNNYSQYPYMVGLRGYYKNQFGRTGLNDRGMYDDALFFLTPDKMYAFNFNTDPGKYGYSGYQGLRKGVPTLKEGVWDYRRGIHKTYEALVQAGNFTVYRDGNNITGGKIEETGNKWGINLHRGSNTSVSSAGCLTIPPGQWSEFFDGVVKKYLPKGQIIKIFLYKA